MKHNETRRLILLGRLTQKMAAGDEKFRLKIFARLEQYLTRDDDRALFGLPSVDPEKNEQGGPEKQ